MRPRADADPRRHRALGRRKRRPWIDWIHTVSDQGALVRDYTKWDNQPASVPAAYEALLRAAQIADTAPRGPTYVNLDAALQEAKIGAAAAAARMFRAFRRPGVPGRAQKLIRKPRTAACSAQRTRSSWSGGAAAAKRLEGARRARREAAGAGVHRHQDAGGLPDRSPAARGAAGDVPRRDGKKLLRDADVVLALDWVDTAGTLKAAWGDAPIGAKVIRVSADAHVAPRLEHGLPGPAASPTCT